MAAEKLERAGFTKVLEFREGIEGWTARRDIPWQAPSAPPGRPRGFPTAATIWIPWKAGSSGLAAIWSTSTGDMSPLAGGHVEFRAWQPASGKPRWIMRRLTCSDLAGSNLHDVLIHHLESDDFFDVARFPEARLSFDAAEICSDKPGCRNLKLRGELTLRGITRPLVIEAAAGFTPEGKAALQSSFTIDRTAWGRDLTAPENFSASLRGHLVNDEIELQLRIVTAERVLG